MNPSAATEAPAEPHWSPDDELLVWTISRIDGGRRQGIEPDCHVVYAVTPTHFVEQTRTYRASAQQCMELLLAGQRAGAIQRKVELDTIMAIHSDPRSGRLIVKTLNGAHRLDPVNEDEADALREIAIHLELRMPAGGAVLVDPGSPAFHGRERRRANEREDWLAERSVVNARNEDANDTAPIPRYEVATHAPDPSVDPRSAVAPRSPAAIGSSEADQASPPAETPSEHPPAQTGAATPTGPQSDVSSGYGPAPSDITIAGGLNITYAPPSSGHPPVTAPPGDDGTPAGPEGDGTPPVPTQAHPIGPSTPPPDPAGGPAFPGPAGDPYGRAFDRRQRRSLFDGRPSPETSDVAPTTPPPENSAMRPLAGSSALTGLGAAAATNDDVPRDAAGEPANDAGGSPVDRRRHEDPAFPSIFDRRQAGPGFRASDDVPNWVSPGSEGDVDHAEAETGEAPVEGTDPPTLAPMSPTRPEGGELGSSVGFNPDFDVNPFR